MSHHTEAVKILGGDLVIAAAQEYVKRHLTKLQHRTVTQAVQEFLQDKERQKRSRVHLDRLKIHLKRFADCIQQSIASVTALEIDRFLDNLTDDDNKPVGLRTRDNHADSIVALFRWVKKKRYVPGDFDEMERITRLDRDEDGTIEIYTPREARAPLTGAGDELTPFLAIGAFAGLRSSEILRLDWADVRTENGDPHIVVRKGKVKKRGQSRRIVPMTDNLKVWLKPHVKSGGPVWPDSEPLLYKRLQARAPEAEALLCKSDPKASLPWKNNALRHSFSSYRVADVKNVAQVALEAGNSPKMIFPNHRELVTEQDGKAWFEIRP